MTPFSAIFVPRELREAVSDRAWLQGMLDAERALAKAEAEVGLVTEQAAALHRARRVGPISTTPSVSPRRGAQSGIRPSRSSGRFVPR